MSSLIPSGNGITALSVIAGAPADSDIHREMNAAARSPLRDARRFPDESGSEDRIRRWHIHCRLTELDTSQG